MLKSNIFCILFHNTMYANNGQGWINLTSLLGKAGRVLAAAIFLRLIIIQVKEF